MVNVNDERPVQITPSQAQRLRTPMMGMIITMVVLSGILAVFWFLNPEPDVTYSRDEDVHEAAAWTDDVTDYSPIAPDVPEGWTANYARWETRTEQGVEVWEAGYTTPDVNFLGFAQTDHANPAWVNAETNMAPATGSITADGMTLETREEGDRRYYVLDAEENSIDGTTVVISTDTQDAEFQDGLDAILDSIGREIPEHDDAEENDD
ncbi:DUF4245 domain-containing protein [Nesterenkonia salmonea]|uniref:DUF4245 domain-containing protein n=1 Tax=Nesterenkonia salmonea TaxID=1804987 RepID=A0A5R9BGB1_9MICC|nr:DUF4245 domain-containing protein [Nesterenkonia salmonea]TLP99524.1 DUF4245 domain-containing protein [Nesterenkonia salmonea]